MSVSMSSNGKEGVFMKSPYLVPTHLLVKRASGCANWLKVQLVEDREREFIGVDRGVEFDQAANSFERCNFGLSGNEITIYINRFLYTLEEDLKFDKAIFFFYEGNDFSSFRYFRNSNYSFFRFVFDGNSFFEKQHFDIGKV